MKTKVPRPKRKMETADDGPAGQFRLDALAFTASATVSKEAALKALVGAGIYTKTGRLAKPYRQG